MNNSRMILMVLPVAFVAAPASRSANTPTPEQEMTIYLKPQLVVHIDKGRTINFVCMGHGSPTVILTAGLGGWSFNWELVQPALAERNARLRLWDRAGAGFSSPSPETQDIVHTTEDLEQALQKAGIRGPYVMVGHSLGAFESLRFTDRNRQSVVGMVLVDPDIPDRGTLDERLAPQFAAVSAALQDQDVKQRRDRRRTAAGRHAEERHPTVRAMYGPSRARRAATSKSGDRPAQRRPRASAESGLDRAGTLQFLPRGNQCGP
jgi:pimeloyl-ACP methyl ester carboxylesterase